MRFGIGYDTHRFNEGNHVMIGGVKISHSKGIEAHSDGDVLLHAIIDAMLGASGLGDIGTHFSDQDSSFKNADSRQLLKKTNELIVRNKFFVHNIDATIVAEHPKISPHFNNIRRTIAFDLGIPFSLVNIKGTTNETMGFIGRGEGIAALAICSLNEAS